MKSSKEYEDIIEFYQTALFLIACICTIGVFIGVSSLNIDRTTLYAVILMLASVITWAMYIAFWIINWSDSSKKRVFRKTIHTREEHEETNPLIHSYHDEKDDIS